MVFKNVVIFVNMCYVGTSISYIDYIYIVYKCERTHEEMI